MLIEFIGRLHPLFVHFPIGLLVGALLLELWRLSANGKGEAFRPGIHAMLHLGTATTLLSVLAGLFLANSGDYGGEQVVAHRNAGFLTAALAVGVSVLAWKGVDLRLYRLSLLACVGALTVAGHWGAELTHGKGFLTEGLFESSDAPVVSNEFVQRVSSADSLSTSELDRLNLEVRAIFAHSCYRCHGKDKVKGELAMHTQEAIMQGGESGPIIVVGDADASELVRRIELPKSHDDVMPKKGKLLNAQEIGLIRLWIDKGAHWADSSAKVFREAPLKLAMPKVPSGQEGLEHPLDKFLAAYWQEKGIPFPEPVDDATFVRRVYLDLTGLLPTPRQINAFLDDGQPDKREVLIDSLLNQSHTYAQHWLSFWNDLLRNDYSGTGFITGGRRQITDWLYTSLEANKPYEQMVKELLNPTPESEGFIKGIRWRGAVNASQRTEMQAAQNISQVFLGLNLKCASCHDSFVSNLTLEQAYGFANIFADSALEIHRCDKPTGKMASTQFLYPELGSVEAEQIKDRLQALAEVVVQPANGRLYRTLVNRLWAELLGRGIVHPVDEMDRLPWSEEVLDWLAADFREHGSDIKHTLRTIMTSRAYQAPSVPYERIDAVNERDFVFEGPLRRRLSAEQFADGLSVLLSPIYPAVAYDPSGQSLEAEWIWKREREVGRDILPKPGKRYFRKTFELKQLDALQEAPAWVSVDHAYTLFVNGREVGSGNDWHEVQRYELKPYLQDGTNLIALEGENEGSIPNPAGLLFQLELKKSDGSTSTVVSDDSWVCTDSVVGDAWKELDVDESTWEPIRRQRASHWGKLVDFGPQREAAPIPFARASLTYLDPFQKALGRPTRENVATSRDDRATLLQALELTNGEFFSRALAEGSEQWLSKYGPRSETLVQDLYLQALGRTPTEEEMDVALGVLGQQPDTAAVEDLLWSVSLLPEFQLIF